MYVFRFQLKLGGDPSEDIERIKACRKVLDVKVTKVTYNIANKHNM